MQSQLQQGAHADSRAASIWSMRRQANEACGRSRTVLERLRAHVYCCHGIEQQLLLHRQYLRRADRKGVDQECDVRVDGGRTGAEDLVHPTHTKIARQIVGEGGGDLLKLARLWRVKVEPHEVVAGRKQRVGLLREAGFNQLDSAMREEP